MSIDSQGAAVVAADVRATIVAINIVSTALPNRHYGIGINLFSHPEFVTGYINDITSDGVKSPTRLYFIPWNLVFDNAEQIFVAADSLCSWHRNLAGSKNGIQGAPQKGPLAHSLSSFGGSALVHYGKRNHE
jgi:hypothetical protein